MNNNLSSNQLLLLISGYFRESLHSLTIPSEIYDLIELWQTRHPKLCIDFIRNFHSFLLEIYLDSKAHKLLNIHSYQIKYGKIAELKYDKQGQYDISHGKIDSSDVKYLTVNAKDIHSDHCIAFIQQDWKNNDCNYHPALFQCVGLDSNGKVLITSETIHCTSGYGWGRCGGPLTQWDFAKYHFEGVIDTDKKGNVNLNQWILAMKRLNICGENQLLLKRIFYYINFIKNRYDAQDMKIDAYDFRSFCTFKHFKSRDYYKLIPMVQNCKKLVTVDKRW